MLNQTLVTKQTGPEGKPVDKVLLMDRLYLRRETYFSIVMDRGHAGPTLVGSPKGGMAIEDVAHETPELIFKVPVDIEKGLVESEVDELVSNMGFKGPAAAEAKGIVEKLYAMFLAKDATLVEINPLAETPDGEVFVCDAKLNFDDNAEFRQKEVFAFRDRAQEDPREVEAAQYDLNYIGLDGSIGCLVNGAGLAMATMDIIKLNGGNPANFLDVGGGANSTMVAKAFEILNKDPKVNAILVNIFGGIMRCGHDRQGASSPRRRRSGSRNRWSFVSKAPTWRRQRQSSRRRDTDSSSPTISTKPRVRSSASRTSCVRRGRSKSAFRSSSPM